MGEIGWGLRGFAAAETKTGLSVLERWLWDLEPGLRPDYFFVYSL
jgi:hypothetical protein